MLFVSECIKSQPPFRRVQSLNAQIKVKLTPNRAWTQPFYDDSYSCCRIFYVSDFGVLRTLPPPKRSDKRGSRIGTPRVECAIRRRFEGQYGLHAVHMLLDVTVYHSIITYALKRLDVHRRSMPTCGRNAKLTRGLNSYRLRISCLLRLIPILMYGATKLSLALLSRTFIP